jgi:hypothetical protein
VRELSQHVLDVVENSLAAGARNITIDITEDVSTDRLTIVIADDGCGMDAETAQRALDPFFTTRTTRHVGLGLPLFKAAAERCAGSFVLESAVGTGTTVRAEFQLSHIDRAPLGDMPATLLGILFSQRTFDLRYRHRRDDQVFELDTTEVRRRLEGVPVDHPLVRRWLVDFLKEGEAGLRSAA